MYFKHKSQNKKKAQRNLIIYVVLFLIVIAIYFALSYYENQAQEDETTSLPANKSWIVKAIG